MQCLLQMLCHQLLFEMRIIKMSLDSPSPDWQYLLMEQSSKLDPNQYSIVYYFALPLQLIWFHPVGFNFYLLRIMAIIHWMGGLRNCFSIEYDRTRLPWFYIFAQCFRHWGHSSRKMFSGFCFLLEPCVLIDHYSKCPLKDFLRKKHSRPSICVKLHNSYK